MARSRPLRCPRCSSGWPSRQGRRPTRPRKTAAGSATRTGPPRRSATAACCSTRPSPCARRPSGVSGTGRAPTPRSARRYPRRPATRKYGRAGAGCTSRRTRTPTRRTSFGRRWNSTARMSKPGSVWPRWPRDGSTSGPGRSRTPCSRASRIIRARVSCWPAGRSRSGMWRPGGNSCCRSSSRRTRVRGSRRWRCWPRPTTWKARSRVRGPGVR